MNYHWRNFQQIAQYIWNQREHFPCDEGACRTIINRIYYCAINCAAVFLRETKGENLPDDHNYHGFIINYYKPGKIHQILNALRDKRRRADYDLESGKFNDMAFAALEDLNELFEISDFVGTSLS